MHEKKRTIIGFLLISSVGAFVSPTLQRKKLTTKNFLQVEKQLDTLLTSVSASVEQKSLNANPVDIVSTTVPDRFF